jgi:hypothetical protein
MLGTTCTTVARPARIAATSSAGSRPAPGPPKATAAPDTSGAMISQPDASKVNGVFCSTRSPGASSRADTPHRTRLAMPSCSTTTPFGVPVDPDVKIR